MIVINDFFKRHKEAVSNQMEYVKEATNGSIITATRFMNQKGFRKKDRIDKIYVYPPVIYNLIMTINVLLKKEDIHVFEEEPSWYKRFIFNLSKRNLYVSMYREPFEEYCNHIKKYKYLKKIYVELDSHKDKLLSYNIDKNKIIVSPTPAKIKRKKNTKKIDKNHINLLFASWNNAEGNPLKERGLIYLLDLLLKNKNFYLSILLRDNKTKQFLKEVEKRNLNDRVRLVDIKEEQLVEEFDNADIVVYPIQKKLTKDVPNSLIDGLSRGKPVLISTIFGLHNLIEKENAGWIIKPNTKPKKLNITKEEYNIKSKNAYNLSKIFTKENYIKSIVGGYEK